jgi:hypothetical protein
VKHRSTHGSVTRLRLARLPGEDDEPAAVLLQPLDVELLALLRLGASAVVDDDAETLGLLLGDAGELDLGKGETTALCKQRISSDSPFPFHLQSDLAAPRTRMLYR